MKELIFVGKKYIFSKDLLNGFDQCQKIYHQNQYLINQMNKQSQIPVEENPNSCENIEQKEQNSSNNVPQQKQQPKKVQITKKELANIQKQLKKLEKLKKENQQLRDYIVALQKKQEQLKKSDLARRGMEETIKELQKLVDQSSKIQEKAKRQESKYKQLYKNESQMNISLKAEVDELRGVSAQYFTLKQDVSRLNNQCRALREAREQYPQMVKKYQELETVIEALRTQLKQKQKQIMGQATIIEKFQKKMDHIHEQKKKLQKQKLKILCEKEELAGEIDAIKQQLEDERTQYTVQNKKTLNEIKQLKIALHQEHEKLRITQHQLQQSKKNVRPSINLQTSKLSSLEKQDLFNLIEQAQMKIVSLKMALDDASDKLASAREKVQEKQVSIMALARQLTKAYPNLDESQGMDYVEKDIIEMGRLRKQDWGEIVQKVMLENLRLKSSVTALGQQYNSRLRSQK